MTKTPIPLAGDVLTSKCPSREILNHLTSKWGVLVLIALRQNGVLRFSELRRIIDGVSERMLAQTLQTFEADGFVIRRAYDVVPPHVEYSLSEIGVEVAERVFDLTFWVEDNIHRIQAQASKPIV